MIKSSYTSDYTRNKEVGAIKFQNILRLEALGDNQSINQSKKFMVA